MCLQLLESVLSYCSVAMMKQGGLSGGEGHENPEESDEDSAAHAGEKLSLQLWRRLSTDGCYELHRP